MCVKRTSTKDWGRKNTRRKDYQYQKRLVQKTRQKTGGNWDKLGQKNYFKKSTSRRDQQKRPVENTSKNQGKIGTNRGQKTKQKTPVENTSRKHQQKRCVFVWPIWIRQFFEQLYCSECVLFSEQKWVRTPPQTNRVRVVVAGVVISSSSTTSSNQQSSQLQSQLQYEQQQLGKKLIEIQ